MTIKTIGIDLDKSSFQVHGIDERGKVVFNKKRSREKLLPFMSNIPPCLVGMEVCCGAHFWARELQKQGYIVKLMAPQFVKPYVKSHENDAADAEAIKASLLINPVNPLAFKVVEFIGFRRGGFPSWPRNF